MTVQEIYDYALLLSGFDEIPTDYVYLYINECMNDLAERFDSAGKKETTYLYGIDEDWTDLPSGCLAVKRVFKDNTPYSEFVVENGQIKFDESGEYKAEILTSPSRVTALTNTPEINQLFHDAIAYYVAYKESTRIFMHEDLTQGNNKILLFTEYNRRAEQANNKIRGMKRSRSRMRYPDFM
jgi:hypothetical protein